MHNDCVDILLECQYIESSKDCNVCLHARVEDIASLLFEREIFDACVAFPVFSRTTHGWS